MRWDYRTEATLEAGVLRWRSNGRVPPPENVTEAVAQGLEVDVAACDATRTTELRAFLAEYRANPPQPTAEDLAEMRSAFGPGATVTNIVTGQRWKV